MRYRGPHAVRAKTAAKARAADMSPEHLICEADAKASNIEQSSLPVSRKLNEGRDILAVAESASPFTEAHPAMISEEFALGSPAKQPFDVHTFLAKVGIGKATLEFGKNQNIFEQGEAADTVYYIQKGRIKLTVLSDQGKEAVVAILEPGQFFGEGCLNGHKLRIATTTAMEHCIVMAIAKGAMISALRDEPSFSELFVSYLLTRNSRIEEDLIDQLFNSSERRLARMLLLLANFGKDDTPQPINPNISQETLAEMIGTTRSRVSFFMNKFRKLGFITYNGRIVVNNSLLSAVLHDKPAIREDE